MTHEELLKVLEETGDAAGFRMDRNAWYTLADIVKLHLPDKATPGEPIVCHYCKIIYPCTEVAIIIRWLT